jgi:hypothetical protein
MSHNDAAIDEGSLQQLAELIRNYLHHTEGRGKNNAKKQIFNIVNADYRSPIGNHIPCRPLSSGSSFRICSTFLSSSPINMLVVLLQLTIARKIK